MLANIETYQFVLTRDFVQVLILIRMLVQEFVWVFSSLIHYNSPNLNIRKKSLKIDGDMWNNVLINILIKVPKIRFGEKPQLEFCGCSAFERIVQVNFVPN